jgi:hypothetical protein
MLFTSRFLPCRDRKLAMRVVGSTRANAGRRRPVQDKVEAWLDSMPYERAKAWAEFIDWVRKNKEAGSRCVR